MPENTNRADLNDLTIRTTQFMASAQKHDQSQDFDDLESQGGGNLSIAAAGRQSAAA